MSERPRGSRGPGPGPGPRGLALLAVAVVLGVALLQTLDSPPTAPGAASASTTTNEPFVDSLPSETTLPIAAAARPPAEVRVLVVNAAGTNGLAKTKSEVIKAGGYTMLTPTTAEGGIKLVATAVQYAGDYMEDAKGVAQLLGLSPDVVRGLNEPPVASAALATANVVVILGADLDAPSTATTTTIAR